MIKALSLRAALTASACMMFTPGIAHAQDADVPPPSEAQAEAGAQNTEIAQGAAETEIDLGSNIDEIIVTAQKREEVLAEVPQSISVVGGETLERQSADNLQDYLALVPGLSLEGSTRGVSRISLRGINTGGVASTVGVYVDEVPFGSSSGLANGAILAGDFDTFDVARIEVLRGPQGTLYGASSLGGVLKFVTNAPDPSAVEGRAQVGIEDVSGGGMGYSAMGMFNAPVSDRAAIRASGFYRKDGGFIDSIGNNPLTNLLDPTDIIIPGTRVADEVNELKTFGGRISALFNASDALSVRLSAMAQNIEGDASDYYEVDPETLEPLYGGLTVSQYHPEFTDLKYRIYSGVVDWDVGFANLTSSTSFSEFEEDFERDYDFLLAQTISLVAALGPDAVFLELPPLVDEPFDRPVGVILQQVTATDKFTQELRLSSPDNDSFEWLLGGFYTHEKSAIDPQNFVAVEVGTEDPIPEIPLLADIFLRSKYEEVAAFANATWHVTPRIDLTFGGRLSRNEQVASQEIDGYPALIGAPAVFEDAKSSESVFTYSVAPRYEIDDDTSIYARVATGYRPGGPNVLPPLAPPGTPTSYDADRLTSYEFGLKGDWLNRRLSLDLSAFYLDWKDIQLFAQVNDVGINANGGTAVSKGLEFTATARPATGLTLSLNGAHTDAYLTEDTDPLVGGLDGDPLPYVPKWSLNLNTDYEYPIGADGMFFVGGSISYTSDRSPDFGVRDAEGELIEVPGYTTFDLRTGVETGRWLVQAYIRNLTNERGITSLFGTDGASFPNGAAAVGVIRPRTIGLTVGTRL